jgi:hypothetical protein
MHPALVPSDEETWEPAIPPPQIPAAMWQQQIQLIDLFHNDMILKVQMFAAMHREHLASVRDELSKVQRLTRELNALQARLNHPAGSADDDPTGVVARPAQDRGTAQPGNRGRRDQQTIAGEPSRAGRRAQVNDGAGSPELTRPKIASDPGSRPTTSNESSARHSAQAHALLTKRITELQRERQGYWQRILNAISK